MVTLSIIKKVPVEARAIHIHAKVRDCLAFTISDQDGNEIADYDGYVPDFFPEDHHGDYLILDIDIDTGMIKN